LEYGKFGFNLNWLMAGRPMYLLIFWIPSPRLELLTLAGYSIAHNDQEDMEIELWQYKVPVKQ
jgi:hypothetical protein